MTDQREPTRRSARVVVLWLVESWELPTAKHTRPSGHDTPANEAESTPSGTGAVCKPQKLMRPNQRSATGGLPEPTAVQVRLRGHETAIAFSGGD
jgi:hypothetical protein